MLSAITNSLLSIAFPQHCHICDRPVDDRGRGPMAELDPGAARDPRVQGQGALLGVEAEHPAGDQLLVGRRLVAGRDAEGPDAEIVGAAHLTQVLLPDIEGRPATAKGMVFMTLEDETGLANLVFTPDVFARLRPLARDEPLVIAHGKVERQGEVVNLRVEGIDRLEAVTQMATIPARNFR